MMTFGPIIETLLAGEFICSQRFPEYHRQLQDETLQNQINDTLLQANLKKAIKLSHPQNMNLKFAGIFYLKGFL